MVDFGLLMAEICCRVWGTPANFNGFRVLAALLHGILAVGISQTLRRWTDGIRASNTLGIGSHSSCYSGRLPYEWKYYYRLNGCMASIQWCESTEALIQTLLKKRFLECVHSYVFFARIFHCVAMCYLLFILILLHIVYICNHTICLYGEQMRWCFWQTHKNHVSQCSVRWIGVWQIRCAATADTTVNESSARPTCCRCRQSRVPGSAVARPTQRRCRWPACSTVSYSHCD